MRANIEMQDMVNQRIFPRLVEKKKARVSVCGLGYVGIVTSGCLADLGHDIVGVDTDKRKLTSVARGESPISEPGLGKLLTAGVENNQISVTGSLMRAV